MDLVGKTLNKQLIHFSQGANLHKIDLNNLANGIYIIRLENAGKVYTEKLVIDK